MHILTLQVGLHVYMYAIVFREVYDGASSAAASSKCSKNHSLPLCPTTDSFRGHECNGDHYPLVDLGSLHVPKIIESYTYILLLRTRMKGMIPFNVAHPASLHLLFSSLTDSSVQSAAPRRVCLLL